MEDFLTEGGFLAPHRRIQLQGVVFKIFNRRARPIRARPPAPAPGGPLLGHMFPPLVADGGRCGGPRGGAGAVAVDQPAQKCFRTNTWCGGDISQQLPSGRGGVGRRAGGPTRLPHVSRLCLVAPSSLATCRCSRSPCRASWAPFCLQQVMSRSDLGGASSSCFARRNLFSCLLALCFQDAERLERTGGTDAASPQESGALPL